MEQRLNLVSACVAGAGIGLMGFNPTFASTANRKTVATIASVADESFLRVEITIPISEIKSTEDKPRVRPEVMALIEQGDRDYRDTWTRLANL